MKIKSISDVITNSSTEVFLLDTNKTLEEVTSILKDLTEGYLPPVYLNSKIPGNPLEMVFSFGDYLWDNQNPRDRQLYAIKILTEFDPWEYEFYDRPIPPGLPELAKSFESHLDSRWDEIKELLGREWWTDIYWGLRGLDEIPEWILSDFSPLPDCLKIPQEKQLSQWEGKIGFSGVEDNSIPYETWDKIIEVLGGDHYHLG